MTATPMMPSSSRCLAPSWGSVTPQVQQSSGSLHSLRAMIQGGCLFVSVELGASSANYALVLDTDGNASTGYKSSVWSTRAGAEYLVQAGLVRPYTGTGAAESWSWGDGREVDVVSAERTLEFRIPLSAIQSSASTRLWFAFMQQDASFAVTGKIPSTGSFAPLVASSGSTSSTTTTTTTKTPDRSACTGAASSWTLGARVSTQGMIVPAYLPTNEVGDEHWARLSSATYDFPAPFIQYGEWQVQGTDSKMMALTEQEYTWLRLVRASAAMSGAGLDLWAVVNGSNSAPPSSSAEWTRARDIWDGVRGKGGRIFGYVHTLKRAAASSDFVEIEELMRQIKAWVSNYPALDGIFLDEYVPRYELFGVSTAGGIVPASCSSKVAAPTYPNGVCASPVDRSFVDQNGCYDPEVQVDPTGGYYHTLIGRIRAAYPWLIVVGNSGGWLDPNQLLYADLVDVLLSHEQSFSAANADWSDVRRQDPTTSASEAALFHGTSSGNVSVAIDRALEYGYSHAYATDQVYSSTSNVWGALPAYLESQVDLWIQRRGR